MDIKHKAMQAKNLLADLVLREALDGLRQEQMEVFVGHGPIEALTEARHIMWSLDALEARLSSFIDDGMVFDRRHNKVAPQ
jgi:hypothetical protein